MKRAVLAVLVFVMVGGLLLAQYRRGNRTRYGGGGQIQTARQLPSGSTGTPTWENPQGFAQDVFTFARLQYTSGYGGWGYGGGWLTDAPDSDLNLSYRLQQMTSMRVDPDGRFVAIQEAELARFPWVYIVEPGSLEFSQEEAATLRRYLLNGGFVMFDDFWGDSAWRNVEQNMRAVFPDRKFVELPLDHPLYRCVFEIKAKGQVPNVRTGHYSQYDGVTWEGNHDGDTRTVHHRVIFDDKGRIMVLATHNTDNGDGWEREGESAYYFHNFSEKIAYPLGINVIFYVMTH